MNMSIGQSFGSFSATSQTQPKPPPPPPPPPREDKTQRTTSSEDILTLLDVDESGDLSATEIVDSPLSELIGDGFATADTDSDGSLNLSELNAHASSMPPPPPPASSEADIASLFEGLFASLESGETTTSDATTYAEEIYTLMQEISAT